MKNIVIVGGGFAGLLAAKKLARKSSNFRITLIDRQNHHLFQPLLYQVATAGLSPAEIAFPIRSVFSRNINVRVVLGNVTGVRLPERYIEMPGERLAYDYLVLACGSKHSYFGHDEWGEYAPGLKTLADATLIRKKILTAFELAEKEGNDDRRKELLTFVIVGAGPTGVELAGAISEIARHTLKRDFRAVDLEHTRIVLVEGGPRPLAAFHPSLSQRTTQDLKKLGVELILNTMVVDVNEREVKLSNNSIISSRSVIWAAGVQPSSLSRSMGVPLDNAGRVIVEPTLNITSHPEVFVLGDMAHTPDTRKGFEGQALPGLAPVAMQAGRHCANNILRMEKGIATQPFKYGDKGQTATIGRSHAVVQIGQLRLGGFVAWIMWLVIHIYYLIGFRNRFFVILDWAWSYITFRKGARLIV